MSSDVQQMFRSIAPRYDLANEVLSFGTHALWRRAALAESALCPGMRVLDLCTGTGDLAFAIAEVVGRNGEVVAVDFVEEMLDRAREKLQRRGSAAPITFLQGDAMKLEFPAQSFDAVTIAFGIRNVDDPQRCLADIKKLLKPNGRLTVLEFGQATVPVFRELYRFYSSYCMPAIGWLLTGNRAAYQYLPETAERFPAGERFLALLRAAGFRQYQARALFGGIAYVYCADADTAALASSRVENS